MSRRASEWEKIVAELEAGGSLREVAARHGVVADTLRWWRSHFRGGRTGRQGKPRPQVSAKSVRMVPVLVRSDTPSDASDARIEVAIRGATLRVRVGQDPQYIAELAAALAARC